MGSSACLWGVCAAIYFLFKWTGFLLKESEEPFRDTFTVKEFKRACGEAGKRATLVEEDRFLLLHYDLIERINRRFKQRFSLLELEHKEDKDESAQEAHAARRSHIHIRGNYAVREKKKDKWIVQVMPFLRIGLPGQPEVVVDPPHRTGP